MMKPCGILYYGLAHVYELEFNKQKASGKQRRAATHWDLY